MQVLVDADNVPASRLRVVVAALLDVCGIDPPTAPSVQSNSSRAADSADAPAILPTWLRIVVAGRSYAIDAIEWPRAASLIRIAGWQEADMALAGAYTPDDNPLLLATGDGDFGLLAGRHAGQVLVVSPLASGRLRDAARVIDPAVDGGAELRDWLRHVTRRDLRT